MNKVVLMGRLTRNPDVRYTNSSSGDNFCIARYTVAVDRRFKRSGDGDSQTADFISCVSFGKTAEFIEKYIKQGTKIALCGRIQTGSYTNKEGQKVYTTEVVGEEVEFAESKNASSGSQGDGRYEPQSAPSTSDAGPEGFMNIPDSAPNDLPFK